MSRIFILCLLISVSNKSSGPSNWSILKFNCIGLPFALKNECPADYIHKHCELVHNIEDYAGEDAERPVQNTCEKKHEQTDKDVAFVFHNFKVVFVRQEIVKDSGAVKWWYRDKVEDCKGNVDIAH